MAHSRGGNGRRTHGGAAFGVYYVVTPTVAERRGVGGGPGQPAVPALLHGADALVHTIGGKLELRRVVVILSVKVLDVLEASAVEVIGVIVTDGGDGRVVPVEVVERVRPRRQRGRGRGRRVPCVTLP